MRVQGKCEILEEAGEGGLGVTIKCRDEKGLIFVAKFPKDHSPEKQEMLDDEVRRLQRHQSPYVVKYLGEVILHDGRRGYAMEPMDGSLAGLVAQQGAMPPDRALGFFSQVVRGLAEVHASAPGAFHGDVKLANVLYKGTHAKIADFGLARGGLGQTCLVGGHQGGTPGYFPPERLASPKGDVYSVGVMLWALLAGREPHPTTGPYVKFQLKPMLDQLLSGMLEREPHARLTIRQVLEHLPRVEAEARAQNGKGWVGAVLGLGAVAGGIALAAYAIAKGSKEWDPQVQRFRGAGGRFVAG